MGAIALLTKSSRKIIKCVLYQLFRRFRYLSEPRLKQKYHQLVADYYSDTLRQKYPDRGITEQPYYYESEEKDKDNIEEKSDAEWRYSINIFLLCNIMVIFRILARCI